MKRFLYSALVGVCICAGAGCGKKDTGPIALPAASTADIPKLVEAAETPGIGRKRALAQLKDLGPQAKDALPKLKQIRTKATKDGRAEFDAVIAAIEGKAPPTK